MKPVIMTFLIKFQYKMKDGTIADKTFLGVLTMGTFPSTTAIAYFGTDENADSADFSRTFCRSKLKPKLDKTKNF